MPGYETVPLEYDEITVAAVQMNPMPVTLGNLADDRKRNLEHMLYLCDVAQQWPIGRKQLLVFPEFTLTGFSERWTRDEWLKVAIMVPGPETEALAKKAREWNCYIAFGSHTQDREWPGHFFNSAILIGPKEGVIHVHWKAYGGFPGMGLEYSTCAHDVLDKYVAKYGWDAVWQVAKTPIGNIAVYICSEGFAPETARAFAFNGAEILCRCIGGAGEGLRHGRYRTIFRADCAASMLYGVYSNGGSGETLEGVSFGHPDVNYGGGGSMIVGPHGQILQEATDSREEIVSWQIPIALHRKTHTIPNIRTEIYAPVLTQHPGQFPPNIFADYLPKNADEAREWSLKHKRW